MDTKELIAALKLLDDGRSRPVTILEREICTVAANKIEALEMEIQYLAQNNLELQMRLDVGSRRLDAEFEDGYYG